MRVALAAIAAALSASERPSYIGQAQPGVRVFAAGHCHDCPPCPTPGKPVCCNANCETVIFSHSGGGPGYLSHLWLAGGTTAGTTLENTTARY